MGGSGTLKFNDNSVIYEYNDVVYRLSFYPYEPCLYIILDDVIICTLHNAFTTEQLKKAFSEGKKVDCFGKKFDEQGFCKVLAAVLDNKRKDMDFFYAADLVKDD